jgi:hypothetical protein
MVRVPAARECLFGGLTWEETRMRALRLMLASAVAVTMLSFVAGPAAAFTPLSESGQHGDYSLTDWPETPGAKCSYGDVAYSNWAYLVSMKVYAPHVFAKDLSAEQEHSVVGWRWQLQWKEYDKVAWHTIKSTQIQKRTAYDDQEADFSAMRLNYDSEKDDPTHIGAKDVIFRARVIIKWYAFDGSVEGKVTLKPDWYVTDTYWAAGPSDNYCQRINTDG